MCIASEHVSKQVGLDTAYDMEIYGTVQATITGNVNHLRLYIAGCIPYIWKLEIRKLRYSTVHFYCHGKLHLTAVVTKL